MRLSTVLQCSHNCACLLARMGRCAQGEHQRCVVSTKRLRHCNNNPARCQEHSSSGPAANSIPAHSSSCITLQHPDHLLATRAMRHTVLQIVDETYKSVHSSLISELLKHIFKEDSSYSKVLSVTLIFGCLQYVQCDRVTTRKRVFRESRTYGHDRPCSCSLVFLAMPCSVLNFERFRSLSETTFQH